MHQFRLCGRVVEVYHYQVTYTEQFPGEEPVTRITYVPTLEEAQEIADQHGGEVAEMDSSAYEWMDGMELPGVPEPYDEAVRIFEQGEAAYREGQSEADDLMAMLVDQEYRLTLLEMEAK